LNPPNPNCPVCSVAQAKVKIDLARATLNDLVENVLRQQLEYGEEFSINTEQGTIYDPDLEDNLPKKLSRLGITTSSFLTVVDEDDEQPRVNLQLVVVSPEEANPNEQPIILVTVPEITRKPKAPTPAPEPDHLNGTANLGKRKRDADEAELGNGDPPTKRVAGVSLSDGVDHANPINLDETDGGAILIDD
jgi:ubiquitin-like 1-activating enzyme E1 B